MANIIHESAGATSKNLAVTGAILTPPPPPPQYDDMIIDLRNYLGVNWGDHLIWTDQRYGLDFTPHVGAGGGLVSQYSPTQGEGISGQPSMVFGLSGVGDSHKNLQLREAPAEYGSHAPGYTMAAVFKSNTVAGKWNTIFGIFGPYAFGPPDYVRTFKVATYLADDGDTYIWVDYGTYLSPYDSSSLSIHVPWSEEGWHILVVSLSFAGDSCLISVDGGNPTSLWAPSGGGQVAVAGYPYVGALMPRDPPIEPGSSILGNLAAVQVWARALTEQECLDAAEYLRDIYLPEMIFTTEPVTTEMGTTTEPPPLTPLLAHT